METEQPLIPADEPARMRAVRRYAVLDTPPDGAFDRITALAARHFAVPIAIVSIVDTDRIWFKSHHGLDGVQEIGREPGLCASAILHDEPWVVENAPQDPRTLANPLVAGEFGLEFYAGAPLTTGDGHNLGTLCVIDRAPRTFSDEDAAMLSDMAAIVMDELELRLAARRAFYHERELREQAQRIAAALQESLLPPALPAIDGAELAALYRPSDVSEVGGDFYDVFALPGAAGRWGLVVGDVTGKGPAAAAVTALARHTLRAAALTAETPADTLRTLNQAMFLGPGDADPPHFCTVLVVFAERRADGLDVVVARAGHPPAIVLRADGGGTELECSGTPAGWAADAVYTDSAAHLSRGDSLLLYTDGITEARTAGGQLTAAGLLDALAPERPATADGLIARMRMTLDRDDVDVRDDAAALVLTAR